VDREASTVFDSVRRIALAAAAPAALLAVAAAPAHADTTRPAVVAGPTTEQVLMDGVIARTNEERVLAGCEPLTVEEELMIVSVGQSQ